MSRRAAREKASAIGESGTGGRRDGVPHHRHSARPGGITGDIAASNSSFRHNDIHIHHNYHNHYHNCTIVYNQPLKNLRSHYEHRSSLPTPQINTSRVSLFGGEGFNDVASKNESDLENSIIEVMNSGPVSQRPISDGSLSPTQQISIHSGRETMQGSTPSVSQVSSVLVLPLEVANDPPVPALPATLSEPQLPNFMPDDIWSTSDTELRDYQAHCDMLKLLANALRTYFGSGAAASLLLEKVAKVILDSRLTLEIRCDRELNEIHKIIVEAITYLPPSYSLFSGTMTEAKEHMRTSSRFDLDYSGLYLERRGRVPSLYDLSREFHLTQRRVRILFLGMDETCREMLSAWLKDRDIKWSEFQSTVTLNDFVVVDKLHSQHCGVQVTIEVIEKPKNWRSNDHRPNDDTIFSVLFFKIHGKTEFNNAWKEVCLDSKLPRDLMA